LLQCSGNGRSEYAGIPGTPWGLGGVGNVRFGGVPLSAVLARYQVEVDAQVRYVTAEGQDLPAGVESRTSSTACPVLA
jgi:sulfite oxidase